MPRRFHLFNLLYWSGLSLYLTLKEASALGMQFALVQFVIFVSFDYAVTATYRYKFSDRKDGLKRPTLLFIQSVPWIVMLATSVLVYDIVIDQIHYRKEFLLTASYLQTLLWYFMDGVIIALPWFLFYHTYRFGRYASDLEKDRALKEVELNRARIENLTQKLNPHFLFNTLNTIRWLAIADAERARTAIDDLSEILRYATNTSSEILVPLEREIDIVRRYLSMEALRFEDLDYRLHCPDELSRQQVPLFSLINLVENAVTHGVSQSNTSKKLMVEVYEFDGEVVIEITNNGKMEKLSKGFGIASIENMLKQSFGSLARLSVESRFNEVVSTIRVPRREY